MSHFTLLNGCKNFSAMQDSIECIFLFFFLQEDGEGPPPRKRIITLEERRRQVPQDDEPFDPDIEAFLRKERKKRVMAIMKEIRVRRQIILCSIHEMYHDLHVSCFLFFFWLRECYQNGGTITSQSCLMRSSGD